MLLCLAAMMCICVVSAGSRGSVPHRRHFWRARRETISSYRLQLQPCQPHSLPQEGDMPLATPGDTPISSNDTPIDTLTHLLIHSDTAWHTHPFKVRTVYNYKHVFAHFVHRTHAFRSTLSESLILELIDGRARACDPKIWGIGIFAALVLSMHDQDCVR